MGWAKTHKHPEFTDKTIWEVFEAQRGVLINPTGSQRLRAVTNCEVSTSDIEHVIGVVAEVMVGERVLTAD